MFMNLKDKIFKAFSKFEDALMTNHSCICCGMEVADGTPSSICSRCQSKIERLDGRVCAKCGDKLFGDTMVCDHCKNTDFEFQSNHSFCYYGEAASEIIKNFKYGGRRYYAKYLAALMAENREIFEGIDYLTFVPMSKNRLKSRGFNQAKLLALEISKLVGIEVVEVLSKDDTKFNQAKLNQAQRMTSLSGTFHLLGSASLIKNKKILIIDDVFTTGSTLNECSKEIKKAKPGAIFTLTFAKTKYNLPV